MIKVNGVTLIERMLHQIEKNNLDRIVIVVGYKGKKLIDYINTLGIKTPIEYVENPIYNKTNNIYSLSLAKNYLLNDDTLLFESDLIFEDEVINLLLEDDRENLALVDKYESWMDGTCVKINKKDEIEAFIPGKKFKYDEIANYYKTVNIYKFSKNFSEKYYVPFLDAYIKALGENEYYEQVLRVITMLDYPEIKAKRLNGQSWYEIDDIQDLDIATSIFTPNEEEKIQLLQERYGGYWRYPKLIDFCYLVNPYFPPQKLIDEIKASFEKLITQYPSGMKINSLLAAKNLGIHAENVVIGNGATELIKALMGSIEGNIGFIRPTFEEYPNRYNKDKSICYNIDDKNYYYDENDIMNFFNNKKIDALVLINPDNPSGNYIKKNGLINLIEWTKERGIQFIVDESFVDFADESDSTLIKQDILDNNNNLFVMKSISKSFGVPGLRLGVLASGNTEKINIIKKDVSIWNINSFAEFYMQIYEKYQKDYQKALEQFRKERKRFYDGLVKLNGIRVLPSQANYFMIELINGMTAKSFTKTILLNHNIIIKDLSKKVDGQFLRIAVRNSNDNNLLIKAFQDELE